MMHFGWIFSCAPSVVFFKRDTLDTKDSGLLKINKFVFNLKS